MPCMDYGYSDDYAEVRRERERCDMLARIACRAIQAVQASGDTALLDRIMDDKETKQWWRLHAAADRLAKEREAKEREKAAAKQALLESAFAKMSDEEVKAFGLKRPVKKVAKAKSKTTVEQGSAT